MFVRALMLNKNELVIASPNENIKTALKKMEDNSFLSIPVVDGKTFLGFISKENIYKEYFKHDYKNKDDFLENTNVNSLYSNIIPKINSNDFIEDASSVIETYGIPFAAVVNGRDEFEGIITHYEIFHTFGELFGINEGYRIAVTAFDVPGQLAKLSDVIARAGGDIISLTIVNPKVKMEVKEIVIRVKVLDIKRLIEKIKDYGFKIQ